MTTPPQPVKREHYWPEVPGLGNIAVSRHAQARMDALGIPDAMFYEVLSKPTKIIDDAKNIRWHDGKGIRIVILTAPEPYRGAWLVKTVFRMVDANKIRA